MHCPANVSDDYFIIDMFSPNTYFTSKNMKDVTPTATLPSFITKCAPASHVGDVPTKNFVVESYEIITTNMGVIKMDIVYATTVGDYINNIRLTGNGLFVLKSRGLLVDENYCLTDY
jgi:hypothetical protein